jgi:multiple sugar transport system permease protein
MSRATDSLQDVVSTPWNPGRIFRNSIVVIKPYLFVAPAMAILLALIIYPLIFSFSKSLTDFNLGMPGEMFIGLKNYVDALVNETFRQSLGFSLLYSLLATSVEFALGFATALLLQREFAGKRIITVLLILPLMVTPVVVGIIWLLMFQPDFSVINGLLSVLGVKGPIWLQNKWTARMAVIIADIWQWTPFFTLVLLGGLLSLPVDVVEAARVDGASGFQILRHVKIPILMPLILVVLLIRLIDSFKTFDSIFIMTNGGPGNATEVLSLHIYRTGLPFMNVSYAAAMSYLFLIIMIVGTTVLIRRLQRIQER